MDIALWLLPVVGALIGWLTNEVAVRMLFHPKRPLKIPFTTVAFQGVLPRRHADLASSIGRTVADDLLPSGELLRRLDLQAYKDDLVGAITNHVARRFEQSPARILPGHVRMVLASYVRDVVEREASLLLEQLLEQVGEDVVRRIDVREMVEQKMMQFDLDELERLARRIAGKELQAIVVFGAVLGLLIGLMQMAVVAWLLPAGGGAGG